MAVKRLTGIKPCQQLIRISKGHRYEDYEYVFEEFFRYFPFFTFSWSFQTSCEFSALLSSSLRSSARSAVFEVRKVSNKSSVLIWIARLESVVVCYNYESGYVLVTAHFHRVLEIIVATEHAGANEKHHRSTCLEASRSGDCGLCVRIHEAAEDASPNNAIELQGKSSLAQGAKGADEYIQSTVIIIRLQVFAVVCNGPG